jgi:hypothetical protein
VEKVRQRFADRNRDRGVRLQPAPRRVERPLRRHPAVRSDQGRALQARARDRDGREPRRGRRIANDPAAPTFQNTIAAMENTARRLDRVGTIYGIWSSTMNGPEFQAVEREMAPKLAAFSDQITQNEKLFRRIAGLQLAGKASLTPEQQRLAWLYYTNFVRAGAKLDDTAKKRLSEINQELANLYTTFSQNVLADETDRSWSRQGKRSRRTAAVAARCRIERRDREGSTRQVGDLEHTLVRRSVPHLLRAPRSAREGVAHVRQPRRQRRQDRQQRHHHRDPEAPRRARQAPRLPDPRALAPREQHGQDARARHGADGSGLDAGRRACA